MLNNPGKRCLVIALILSLIPLCLTIVPAYKLSHDAATYAALGKNLASGDGYTYQGFSHVKYPPGFPLLLAGIFALWGKSFLAQRILVALFAAAALFFSWRLVRERSGPRIGLLVLGTMGVVTFFLEHAGYTLTDVPFLLITVLFCLTARRLLRRPGWGIALVTGLLCGLALAFRLVGLLFLPALVMAWFTCRPGGEQKTAGPRPWLILALAILVALVPLGLWLGYKATAGPLLSEDLRDGATYIGELRGGLWLDAPQGFFATLVHQLKIRPLIFCGTCGRFLTGGLIGQPGVSGWTGLTGWPSILSLLLVMGAALTSLWRHRGILDWFFFIYLAVLMVTPPFVGPRYFIPILPFLLGSLLEAGALIGQRIGRDRGQLFATMGLGFLLLLAWLPRTVNLIGREHRQPYYQDDAGALTKMVEHMSRTTEPLGVTICNEAALVHYLSGRPTLGFPLTNKSAVKSWILARGDHVLLSSWGYQVNEIFLHAAVIELVQEGKLVPVHQEATAPAPGGAPPLSVLLRVKK